MTKYTHICVFCDKKRDRHEIIEGMNGDICKSCLAVIQTIQSEESIHTNNNKWSITGVKRSLDTLVMGQDEAKKQLIVELYKHYNAPTMKKNNAILVGDSGVGKTYLVRTLAGILNVPFMEVDITAFSETGYKGKEVTDFLDELIIQQKGDIDRIEDAIIFLDEIDKMTTTSANGEQSTKLQHALLKVVEGIEYNYNIPMGNQMLTGTIDTSKIMFVSAGACMGLSNIRKERLTPRATIGFNSGQSTTLDNKVDSLEYTSEDLIEFGFIPEFVGRFPLVIELHPLTKDNIVDILARHPNSPIYGARKLFGREGIDLIVTDKDIDWLAEESIKHPLGVRSVSHILTKRLNNQLFDSLSSGEKTINLKDALNPNVSKTMTN